MSIESSSDARPTALPRVTPCAIGRSFAILAAIGRPPTGLFFEGDVGEPLPARRHNLKQRFASFAQVAL